MKHQTVSLIGMPGAGKSTVGVLLARLLGLNFLDTDLLIQSRHRATLQQLLERRGYLALRGLEQAVLLDIPLAGTLVATGGSAVFSAAGMQRLRAAGPVAFIDVPLKRLQRRLHNERQRGIARAPGQSLAAVFSERQPLYLARADIIADGARASAETIATRLAGQLAD